MKAKTELFKMLKGLYLDELVFIADKLSRNREKWGYDKRSKASVRKAIVSNAEEHTIASILQKSLSEEMPSGNFFPDALQIEKEVLGPLGCLKSVELRNRYDADIISKIFDRYIRGSKLLEKTMKEHQAKIPKEILSLALEKRGPSYKPTLTQLVLTYFSNKEICNLINAFLAKQEIKIDITGLYEDIEHPWIITRFGITLVPEDEPIENLAGLIREYYEEDDLGPELRPYSGDFKTKLLEYCIMENPETLLQKLFGLPELRQIAKKLGFVSDDIGTILEAISIILLGLGFDVPPSIVGASACISSIERCGRDLSEAREAGTRSGIMSQVFVIAERALHDIAYFYIFFLWRKKLEDLESTLEDEMPELSSRQVKIESLDLFILKRFGIKKAFERLGFGDLINLIKATNNAVCKSKALRKKLNRKLDRTCALENKDIRVLDSISPFRSSFAHAKNYPGDEKCEEILKSVLNLLRDFRKAGTYPMVIRISREVSDEYGKSYAECLDENGGKWLLYTKEYLETSRPYFFYSKTSSIAVNPVVVEKVF
jgi:hypothetical protein